MAEYFKKIEHLQREEINLLLFTSVAVLVGAYVDRRILYTHLDHLFHDYLQQFSKEISDTIANQLIPMSRDLGVSRVYKAVNFRDIIEKLEANDSIDILFTFHPHIETYFVELVEKIKNKNVKCRLLLGSSESPDVKKRFSYIAGASGEWSGDKMLRRLKDFWDNDVPGHICLRLEAGCFKEMPDLPLIIVSKQGLKDQSYVKRVYQGYYLKYPAMELPFIEWIATNPRLDGEHDRLKSDCPNMVGLFADYFEAMWADCDDTSKLQNPIDVAGVMRTPANL